MAHKVDDDVIADDGLGNGGSSIDPGIVFMPIGQQTEVFQPIVHNEWLVRVLEEYARIVGPRNAVVLDHTPVRKLDLDADALDIEELIANEGNSGGAVLGSFLGLH